MKSLDIFTDWTVDKLENIQTDEIQPFFGNYQKINLFNFNKPFPLQKIYLRAPKMKITNTTFYPDKKKSKGFVTMNLFIHKVEPEIKKFFLFIKKLEKKVKLILTEEYEIQEPKLKSSFKKIKDNFIIFTVRLPYSVHNNSPELDFNIYNHKNQKINQEQFYAGQYALTILELSEVYLQENEFAFNFNVVQMKIIPEFDFTRCLFTNNEYNEDDRNSEESNKSIPVAPSLTTMDKIKNTKKTFVHDRFAPTIADLKSVKLKPVILSKS